MLPRVLLPAEYVTCVALFSARSAAVAAAGVLDRHRPFSRTNMGLVHAVHTAVDEHALQSAGHAVQTRFESAVCPTGHVSWHPRRPTRNLGATHVMHVSPVLLKQSPQVESHRMHPGTPATWYSPTPTPLLGLLKQVLWHVWVAPKRTRFVGQVAQSVVDGPVHVSHVAWHWWHTPLLL